MAEFDFEARRTDRAEAEGGLARKQNELTDRLNERALELGRSIEKYAEGKCEIEVNVNHNEVVLTKKMTGVFLKLDYIMSISLDAQGTFAVNRGDYDHVVSANGQTGSLTEAEMIDAVADWLGKSKTSF